MAFPEGIKTLIQYVSGIEAMVSYLHSRQYMPYKRMKKLLKACFGICMCEGSIANIIERFALKVAPVYAMIEKAIGQSPVIGVDETGAKVNGKNHWVWTYQTGEYTLLALSQSRGLKAIKSHFPNDCANAILCHGAWSAYFHYSGNQHQLCRAHLLRDLNYIIGGYHSTLAESLKTLFIDAIPLKEKLHKVPNPEQQSDIESIENRMNDLLRATQDYRHKEGLTLQKRLLKYRTALFTFLYHQQGPPYNNASERAIRNIKMKQKVSGQFKSEAGAENFCVIRSIVDALIKRSKCIGKSQSYLQLTT